MWIWVRCAEMRMVRPSTHVTRAGSTQPWTACDDAGAPPTLVTLPAAPSRAFRPQLRKHAMGRRLVGKSFGNDHDENLPNQRGVSPRSSSPLQFSMSPGRRAPALVSPPPLGVNDSGA